MGCKRFWVSEECDSSSREDYRNPEQQAQVQKIYAA